MVLALFEEKKTAGRSSAFRFEEVKSSRFEDGEIVTSLTQAIHPPVVGPMVMNVFAHVVGLEVGSFLDDSGPPITAKMSEYQGEPSDLTVHQIPPVLVGNETG